MFPHPRRNKRHQNRRKRSRDQRRRARLRQKRGRDYANRVPRIRGRTHRRDCRQRFRQRHRGRKGGNRAFLHHRRGRRTQRHGIHDYSNLYERDGGHFDKRRRHRRDNEKGAEIMLDHQTTLDLLKKAQQGDDGAKEKLIEENMYHL